MATFRKRVDGKGRTRIEAIVRRKGQRRLSQTFGTQTHATKWANRTEADIEAGRSTGIVAARKHTVSEMIDRYVEHVIPTKATGTQEKQRHHLAWWKQRIGHTLLADVAPDMIAQARDELGSETTRRGRQRAPSTVNRYMAALSHCFTVAVQDWAWVEDNPMRKVRKLREPPGRDRFLQEDELERLLQACRNSKDPYLHMIVVLAVSTGMRRDEIMSLTWDRVNLPAGIIVLRPDDTKTQTARDVPIEGLALGELQQLWGTRRTDTDLLFPSPRHPVKEPKPIDIQTAWLAALRRASVNDFCFHDLRHTFASYMLMGGAAEATTRKVLGHKSAAMTQRYSHLTDAYTRQAVAKMNEAVFGAREANGGGSHGHEDAA